MYSIIEAVVDLIFYFIDNLTPSKKEEKINLNIEPEPKLKTIVEPRKNIIPRYSFKFDNFLLDNLQFESTKDVDVETEMPKPTLKEDKEIYYVSPKEIIDRNLIKKLLEDKNESDNWNK